MAKDWKAGLRSCDADPKQIDVAIINLERWLSEPEFAPYRPQLEWLIETEQWPGLLDRFYQILPFGTGGRRGPVGIGPNRMNLWTLGASVQGHCDYLRQRFPDLEELTVVVAFDVRKFEDQNRRYNPELPNPVLGLSSRDFAHYAARIYAANDITCFVPHPESQRYLATPELSFIIRRLRGHGGLNVSASHNPPDDNGGKFYDEHGGQPVPPEDYLMAELVDKVTTIREKPWGDAVRSGRIRFLEEEHHRAYIDLCRRQSLIAAPTFDELRVVFTPLHGVGGFTALEVLEKQGFRCFPVAEQMTPDGRFPNVTKSPNPEVPESMDRAERLAREKSADLVLATDPDADRVGGMVPCSPGDVQSQWHPLTGNQIAAILTHFKLSRLAEDGNLPSSPIVIKTLVTTQLMSRIAQDFGAQLVENLLVGVKYIADVILHLEQEGHYEEVRGGPEDVVIGAEESHGYVLTPHIRDKDAASAALVLAEAALHKKRSGSSLWEYLNDLWRKYGYFCNRLRSISLGGIEGRSQMQRMLESLRNDPPKAIAGVRVTNVEDLRREDSVLGPIKGPTDYAARNFLVFHLGATGRVALRPSGTEPKAKAYIEIAGRPRPEDMAEEQWLRSCAEIDELADEVGQAFIDDALARIGQNVGTA